MAHDSAPVTIAHINRVRELMTEFAGELARRGFCHDASKFDPVEKEPLDEMQRVIAEEGQAPFGSDEYRRRTAMLGPMLQHHYQHNSHHPEHYGEAGVAGMDLADLVEMFFDWKAASERGAESSMNLSKACERFKVEPQLASILRNTAYRLDFEAD
jgi:hypothetical protein